MKSATDPLADKTGREATAARRSSFLGADLVRLPALRLFVALAFLIPGVLFVCAGLVLLHPWLRRFAASLQPLGVLREPTGEAHEPNAPDPPELQARGFVRLNRWRES